jgi:hypothetical protein
MALNYERIMAYRPADIPVSYGERECIIYALGHRAWHESGSIRVSLNSCTSAPASKPFPPWRWCWAGPAA